MQKPVVVCLDLEGVLVPEIWINVAMKTGIEDLKITTREMPDYDKLMRQRLNILDRHALKISDIQDVIEQDGAVGWGDGVPSVAAGALPSDYFVGHVLSVRPATYATARLPDSLLQSARNRWEWPYRELPHENAGPKEACGRGA